MTMKSISQLFAVVSLSLLISMAFVSISPKITETDKIAMRALASEGGWTVTHDFGSGRSIKIVRVQNVEASANQEQGVRVQTCHSIPPVRFDRFQCDEEVFVPGK